MPPQVLPPPGIYQQLLTEGLEEQLRQLQETLIADGLDPKDPRTISPGQRYIHHIERGSNGLLLVREENKGGGITLPFLYLGFAVYMSHQGERAMFAAECRSASGCTNPSPGRPSRRWRWRCEWGQRQWLEPVRRRSLNLGKWNSLLLLWFSPAESCRRSSFRKRCSAPWRGIRLRPAAMWICSTGGVRLA